MTPSYHRVPCNRRRHRGTLWSRHVRHPLRRIQMSIPLPDGARPRLALAKEPDPKRLNNAYRLLRRDPSRALGELRLLVEQGSQMSMLYIGDIYKRGLGTSNDPDEAERWYRRLASSDSVLGYYALGRLYLAQGRYVDARSAFEQAAERGYVPAVHFLGRMYFAAQGVQKDTNKGEELLIRAANAGSVLAKSGLASFYLRSADPRVKLRGARLRFCAIIDFFVVALTRGFGSDRLR